MDFKKDILEAAEKKVLYTPHALHQMNKPERMISKDEVREVFEQGEIIEDYPEDKRGHSCLIAGFPGRRRPIHVVCAPKEDYLAVITTYVPDLTNWKNNFKTRKK